MEAITMPAELLEQMLQQARAMPDVEICGLIAGRRGRAVRCIAVRNVAAEPENRFSMDPREQIDAFRQMREQGEELFGIYHSHPHGPASASATDIAEAGYPEVLQIILSLQQGTAGAACAYRFSDGMAVPVELVIQPSPL
jgi:proteasome lid subunit RPN8/RPN11